MHENNLEYEYIHLNNFLLIMYREIPTHPYFKLCPTTKKLNDECGYIQCKTYPRIPYDSQWTKKIISILDKTKLFEFDKLEFINDQSFLLHFKHKTK